MIDTKKPKTKKAAKLKPLGRTRAVALKVSEADFAGLSARAAKAGVTVSTLIYGILRDAGAFS